MFVKENVLVVIKSYLWSLTLAVFSLRFTVERIDSLSRGIEVASWLFAIHLIFQAITVPVYMFKQNQYQSQLKNLLLRFI